LQEQGGTKYTQWTVDKWPMGGGVGRVPNTNATICLSPLGKAHLPKI